MVPETLNPIHDRFWEKVTRNSDDACWTWNAGVMSAGYGMFHPVKLQSVLAHRFAYEITIGPIAQGMHLDHTCHNDEGCPPGFCEHRLCVNPSHLEPVTSRTNVNRSHNSNIRKTHCPKGHEYTPENVRLQVKKNTTCRKCITCERQRDALRPKRKAA